MLKLFYPLVHLMLSALLPAYTHEIYYGIDPQHLLLSK